MAANASKLRQLAINECSKVFHVSNIIIRWSGGGADLGEYLLAQTSKDR
jgi:hypothetical protein